LIGVRAVLEERMLMAELAGYADYAARVRYRLVPRLW
jgi:protein-S-isoprenylcysteine O-methyltransferase Ste14